MNPTHSTRFKMLQDLTVDHEHAAVDRGSHGRLVREDRRVVDNFPPLLEIRLGRVLRDGNVLDLALQQLAEPHAQQSTRRTRRSAPHNGMRNRRAIG
jgi:hypothetical protein